MTHDEMERAALPASALPVCCASSLLLASVPPPPVWVYYGWMSGSVGAIDWGCATGLPWVCHHSVSPSFGLHHVPKPQHLHRRHHSTFIAATASALRGGSATVFPLGMSERKFGQAEAIREGWTCISSARFACRGSVVCRTFCRCAGLRCAGFRFSVLAWSQRPIPCTVPIPVQIDDLTSFSSSSSLLDDT